MLVLNVRSFSAPAVNTGLIVGITVPIVLLVLAVVSHVSVQRTPWSPLNVCLFAGAMVVQAYVVRRRRSQQQQQGRQQGSLQHDEQSGPAFARL